MSDSYFERVAKNVDLLSEAYHSIRDLRDAVRNGDEVTSDQLLDSLDKAFCSVYYMFGTMVALEDMFEHEIHENK